MVPEHPKKFLLQKIFSDMETLVKQTREVGTSAGVLLPRSWLNRQVVVTLLHPSKEKIMQDILTEVIKQNLNEEIKGIYLFGSYARGDYDSNSDIDILIITHETTKLINHDSYEIMLVTEKDFSKNLSTNLNYLSILKEVKTLFNKELIDKYRLGKHKPDMRKNISEIKSIFNINKDTVETCKENNMNVPDGVVYSIVLRLRELYLIRCLFSDKAYYKKDFLKITGENIYSAYTRIKRNEKELNSISPNELAKILDLSEKWLKELKD